MTFLKSAFFLFLPALFLWLNPLILPYLSPLMPESLISYGSQGLEIFWLWLFTGIFWMYRSDAMACFLGGLLILGVFQAFGHVEGYFYLGDIKFNQLSVGSLYRLLASIDVIEITLIVFFLFSLKKSLVHLWTIRPPSWGYHFGRKRLKSAPHSHGSGRFARLHELRKLNKPQGLVIGEIPKVPFERVEGGASGSGFRNGSSKNDLFKTIQTLKKQKNWDLLKVDVDHALVIAPSGAGKGVGLILPTLLDYKGPILVTDIKGENLKVTANYRRSLGRRIVVFDPFQLTTEPKDTFNVFDFLNPNCPIFLEDVSLISTLLCPLNRGEHGASKYFTEQAAKTLEALILGVLWNPEDPHKNICAVYDLLNSPTFFGQLKDMRDDHLAFNGKLSRLIQRILATEPRELSSTLNTLSQEIHFLDGQAMRSLLGTSTVSLKELFDPNTDIFLCLPSEYLESHGRVLRLFLGIFFAHLQRRRVGRGIVLDVGISTIRKPLLMLIDELPALGYMPQIENILTYGRGYGIKLVAITQTLSNLKAVYPHTWEAFLSTPLSLFWGTADMETATYVSKALGSQTLEVFSQNEGKRRSNGLLSSQEGSHHNVSLSHQARDLLNPSEVTQLGDHIVIGLLRGHKPLLLKRTAHFEHKRLRKRATKI